MAPRAPAPRVDLQPPRAEDRDEFIRAMRASRALHRPWISMPSTPEAYASYIERSTAPATAYYLVRVRADGALAGFFNLSEIVRGKLQSAFLGFGAVAGFEGRGLMGDGMELLLRHAFTTHRLHRVEANIQPGNTASAALARRAGFALEGFSPRYLKVGGRWCDHERWALRSESWKARRRSASASG